MFVISERINGMFTDVRRFIENKDKEGVQKLALAHVEAGSSALDLNVGPAGSDPIEAMKWLVECVQEVTDIALCIDTPRWSVQKEVVPMVKSRAIINSTKADPEDLQKYIQLALDNNAALVALTIDKDGVPSNVDKRLELGAQIVMVATEMGLGMDDLFIDPIILPVNVAPAQPKNVMETLQQLKLLADPAPHLVLGLSNVSQNCANRNLINRVYLVMALAAGLDAAIVDALDKELMDAVITTELLKGNAIYCDSFLEAHRMG